jgi:protein SCO1
MAFRPGQTECPGGSVAGSAIGGPFELVSETGETVTEAEVIDGPTLIYFGYTFCPDVCPFDAARNADAVDLLAERGFAVKPVFITVDPERDTPEVLAEYTDWLHPDMLGLTGSPEQIRRAANAYKVYYAKADEDPEFYLVNHTVLSYLMVPGDGLLAFFRGAPAIDTGVGMTTEELADIAACHLATR